MRRNCTRLGGLILGISKAPPLQAKKRSLSIAWPFFKIEGPSRTGKRGHLPITKYQANTLHFRNNLLWFWERVAAST